MSEQREKGKTGGLAESLVIAFSMYSRIPMPMVEWTERGMKYALCFFPAVGIAVGAAVAAFWYLSRLSGMGELSRICVETALPLLITGGIHMDGFLDTVDARSSHQSRERKLEILKDPHAGAFAIAGCSVYLLFYAAAFSELRPEAFPGIAGIFVMSRALSGYSVVTFPKAKKDGLVTAFAKGAQPGARNCFQNFALLVCRRLCVDMADRRSFDGACGSGRGGSGIFLVPQDGSQGIRRNHRGSGRIFSSDGGAFDDRSSGSGRIKQEKAGTER